MTDTRLDYRTGGVALVLGFLVLLAVIVGASRGGTDSVTSSPGAILTFLVPPLLGLGSGVYVYYDGPLRTVVAFLSGTYLAVAGIQLALLRTDAHVLETTLGIAVLALAVLALVSTLRSRIARLVPEESFL